MRATGLIDTGALIALIDPGDRWHEACLEAFDAQKLPLATTTAVLTELFHLISRYPGGTDAANALLRSGSLTILAAEDQDLSAIVDLMERYADRPMDFADATLVHMAGKYDLPTVLTVDHDDFETYRMTRRRKFRILPPRR